MSLVDRLLTLLPLRTPDNLPSLAEPAEYVEAREEAATVARNLGLDISNEHWEQASIADFLRLCYAQGWKACEAQIMSPDRADEIAVAIEHPEKVVDQPGYIVGTGKLRWQVVAVQRAAVYGVPK